MNICVTDSTANAVVIVDHAGQFRLNYPGFFSTTVYQKLIWANWNHHRKSFRRTDTTMPNMVHVSTSQIRTENFSVASAFLIFTAHGAYMWTPKTTFLWPSTTQAKEKRLSIACKKKNFLLMKILLILIENYYLTAIIYFHFSYL